MYFLREGIVSKCPMQVRSGQVVFRCMIWSGAPGFHAGTFRLAPITIFFLQQ